MSEATYRIDLPITMKDRLKDKARELSVPVTTLVEQALEMVLGGDVKPIIRPREVTVEDAGEILLAHIEPGQASLIRDLCREHSRTPAEYILSYVYLAHERGETATMVGESVLTRESLLRDEAAADGTVCEQCGTALVDAKRGQRFCPDVDDGTESCGRKHSLAELHTRRAAKTKKADNSHAPTQVNVDVYRRAAQTLA